MRLVIASLWHVSFGVAPKRTSLAGTFFESSQRFQKVRDREDALASTGDACATQKRAYATLRDIKR
jgi:hypothetical protein